MRGTAAAAFFGALPWAQSADEFFRQGLRLFAEKQFDAATAAFESACSCGPITRRPGRRSARLLLRGMLRREPDSAEGYRLLPLSLERIGESANAGDAF